MSGFEPVRTLAGTFVKTLLLLWRVNCMRFKELFYGLSSFELLIGTRLLFRARVFSAEIPASLLKEIF